MPIVPTYDPTQGPALKPGSNFRDPTHATGEMFGAGIGAAMGKVAGGMGDIAAAMQEIKSLDDLNRAKEADNQLAAYQRERMYGADGFMAKMGREAVDGQKQFETDMAAARKQYGQGLPIGAQRHYDQASTARLNSSLTSAAVHTMDQRKTWFGQASDARAETFANDALVNYTNPDKVNESVAAGILELREQGKLKGWDSAVQRAKEIEYASGVHKNITLRIASSDPVRADEYRKLNSKFLTGADQYALDEKLKSEVLQETAKRTAEDIMTGSRTVGAVTGMATAYGPGGGPGEGGPNDMRGRQVATLEDYEAGRVPSITLAGDKAHEGKRYTIPSITFTGTDGKTRTLKNVAAEVRDTGGAFKGQPEGRYDIPVAAGMSPADLAKQPFSKQNLQFVPQGDGPVSRPGPTNERAFLLGKLTAGKAADHINGMDGSFARNLTAMMQDAPPEIAKGLGIGSGYRSEQRQAELWNDALRKYGSAEAARKWVAPPGNSQHNFGRAADLTWNGMRLDQAPQNVIDWVHGNAQKYGLYFPLGNEPWHAELVGTRNTGGGTVAARSDGVSARASMPSYNDIETRLMQIPDPRLRDLTRTRIQQMMELRVKAAEQSERAAKAELWRYVDHGKTPDDVPFEVRQAAGMSAVSSAWEYAKKRSDGTFETSDPVLLYDMRRYAAMKPEDFARIDLNDYRDRLAKKDIEELTGKQSSALTDMRKAQQEGANINSAFSQAEVQLEAVGLKKPASKMSDDDRKNLAQFQNVLAMELEAFKKANSDRAPTQMETQQIINKLLMPIVIKQDRSAFNPLGWVGGGQSEVKGFAFQAGTRPEGSTVVAKPDFASIPLDMRRGISLDLERELGRKPSQEEVARRYGDYILRR